MSKLTLYRGTPNALIFVIVVSLGIGLMWLSTGCRCVGVVAAADGYEDATPTLVRTSTGRVRTVWVEE